MHRLVATVEEVAQVAEFPAGTVVNEQHIGAVIAHGGLKFPFVVVLVYLALNGIDHHRVGKDARRFRLVGEAHGGAVGILRHPNRLLGDLGAILQQSHLDFLTTETVRLQFNLGADAVAFIE